MEYIMAEKITAVVVDLLNINYRDQKKPDAVAAINPLQVFYNEKNTNQVFVGHTAVQKFVANDKENRASLFNSISQQVTGIFPEAAEVKSISVAYNELLAHMKDNNNLQQAGVSLLKTKLEANTL
jgi:lipid A disaccharide synthetase